MYTIYLLLTLIDNDFVPPHHLPMPLELPIESCYVIVLVKSRLILMSIFFTSVRSLKPMSKWSQQQWFKQGEVLFFSDKNVGARWWLLFPAVLNIVLCTFTLVKSHCVMTDSAPGYRTTFKRRKRELARVAKSFHLLWTALIRKRNNFLRSYPVQFLLHLTD